MEGLQLKSAALPAYTVSCQCMDRMHKPQQASKPTGNSQVEAGTASYASFIILIIRASSIVEYLCVGSELCKYSMPFWPCTCRPHSLLHVLQ